MYYLQNKKISKFFNFFSKKVLTNKKRCDILITSTGQSNTKKRKEDNIMWYVNYHSAPDIKKVIETAEKAKKNGVKSIIQETQERNNCIYVFTDGFEHRGKQIEHWNNQNLIDP